MAKITFINGLLGSGKTYLAKQIAEKTEAYLLDEGLNPNPPWDESFNKNFPMLIDQLNKGRDCVVIEIFYMVQSSRDFITNVLHKQVADLQIEWIYFENNIEKANKNSFIRAIKGEKPDLNGNIDQNYRLSAAYEIPGEVTTIPIHELEMYFEHK